jgi:hypothetical protein
MYTSIVEYSIIAAAIMYIVWVNIDDFDEDPSSMSVRRRHQLHKRTKHHIRLDCSRSTTGNCIL